MARKTAMDPPTITRHQARELDRRAVEEYGMSGLVLMENAGRGVADKLCQFGINGPVVICCGAGNNGGDGFVVARHLDLRAISVKVLVWGEPKAQTDAAVNLRILEKSGLPIRIMTGTEELEDDLRHASWVVDALLGTGARGQPREPIAAVIQRLNAQRVPIVAVDVPSGLDCDTGRPARHSIRALHTCTFVAAKPGFHAPGADQYTGQLHVLDIGAPRKLVEEVLAEK